jgi:hypothetical protein
MSDAGVCAGEVMSMLPCAGLITRICGVLPCMVVAGVWECVCERARVRVRVRAPRDWWAVCVGVGRVKQAWVDRALVRPLF